MKGEVDINSSGFVRVEHVPRKEEIVEPEDLQEDAFKIGEEVTEVLEMREPEIWVRRIIRPKYASKSNS